MPPGTASYKRLYRRVGAALNALQASTYTAAPPTVNDRRRVEGMIRDAINAKDAAVRAAICSSESNSHRVRYLAYSAELQHGDVIPDHYGAIGEVVIQKVAAGAFEAGIEVESVQQINLWRENAGSAFGLIAHDAANSPLGGFFVTNPKSMFRPDARRQVGVRLRFTGHRAKVEISTFDVSAEGTDPPVLGSPDAFEDVIFAGAVGDSYIEGDDITEIQYYRGYYAAAIPLIIAGASEAPPLQHK